MVVTGAILVARGRTGRLDPTQEALVDEDAERVVHRLAGHSPDARADVVDHVVGRGMWALGDGSHDRQPLRGDLHTVPAKETTTVDDHVQHCTRDFRLGPELDCVATPVDTHR